MNCPHCSYHRPYETVRCPQCQNTFPAGTLEELGHVAYLRSVLDAWRTDGVLNEEVAGRTVALVEARAAELESALGLNVPPQKTATTASAADVSTQPVTEQGPAPEAIAAMAASHAAADSVPVPPSQAQVAM